MLTALQWLGSVTGIVGALWLSLNLRSSRWGWAMFLVSSISWTIVGIVMSNAPLAIMQAVFTAINILGFERWFMKRNP